MTTSAAQVLPLVLQSKKALQQGEQLCSKANELSKASAQASVDVLVLDAKVKWITDNVLEQFKLAASVAKSLEEQRTKLSREAQDWDKLRTKQTNALDKILDQIGSQRVPPDFHQTSAASSIFGDQGDKQSRSNETVSDDRKNWKTLRDFVDDQAIEDILERIEEERTSAEDNMSRTDQYPEKLTSAVSAIREYLPETSSSLSIQQLITSQDNAKVSMAGHLESLAAHYDQMVNALRESEAPEAEAEGFTEDDLKDMNRDTEELPSILAELEEDLSSVTASYDQLTQMRLTSQEHLKRLSSVLDELDELGDIMMEMVQTQESVESSHSTYLSTLHAHLLTIQELTQRFLSYQTSYHRLVLEIARRKEYKEAVEGIVRGMREQLTGMCEEENHLRTHFNSQHGAHLPEDLCLCISNVPTRWEIIPVPVPVVIPWNRVSGNGIENGGEGGPGNKDMGFRNREVVLGELESLPEIPEDIVLEVRNQLQLQSKRADSESMALGVGANGTESL